MRKIILAGVCLQANSSSFTSAMQECVALCNACDLEVLGTVTQQSKSMDPHTAFRIGKLETLKAMCEELGADGIIFYNPLKIQVSDRISAYCGVNVIDRTALILDIFSKRARSRQAKLQTEVARLQYDLPRVLHADN
ncbi:MAG: GTPase HflX, partial [Solobacterium sp.]|nr:GTPase HflX [Solobacterium sp.]